MEQTATDAGAFLVIDPGTEHVRWAESQDLAISMARNMSVETDGNVVPVIVPVTQAMAAPELLEALNWALDVIDAGLSSVVHKGHVDYDQARAAIAKATGENDL